MIRAIFIGEGPSDAPLANIVATLFRREGVDIDITPPDFDRLPQPTRKDVASKAAAALQLTTEPVDLFVVHRDADEHDSEPRRIEITEAMAIGAPGHRVVPVVPIRMTEAWLLLNEHAIRRVSGNPGGRMTLDLPDVKGVERLSDAKALLADAILTASATTGRRRGRVARRFGEHRSRLLEHLDLDGPVTGLRAWQELLDDVHALADELRT